MLTSASLQVLLSWQQSRENTGTNGTVQQGSVAHDLAGISVTEWDELYHEQITLSVSNPTEVIDLFSVLNYVDCAAFAFGRIITLYIKNLGNADGAGDGVVRLTSGSTNPAILFFSAAGDGVDLPPGRVMVVSDDVTLSAAVVCDDMRIYSNASNLKLTHLGGDDAIIEVAIIGSTTVTG